MQKETEETGPDFNGPDMMGATGILGVRLTHNSYTLDDNVESGCSLSVHFSRECVATGSLKLVLIERTSPPMTMNGG